MTDLERWTEDGKRNGWELPQKAIWFLRLPGLRHIRVFFASWAVERHYAGIAPLGLIRTGYDEWVLFAIARGIC